MRYFRLWAAWKRWDEEWIILGAEFDRTVRSFKAMEKVWTSVAAKGRGEAASAQAAADARWEHLKTLGAEENPDNMPRAYAARTAAAQGKCAYGHKKASFYRTLQEEATKAWRSAGMLDGGRGWDGWSPPGTHSILVRAQLNEHDEQKRRPRNTRLESDGGLNSSDT